MSPPPTYTIPCCRCGKNANVELNNVPVDGEVRTITVLCERCNSTVHRSVFTKRKKFTFKKKRETEATLARNIRKKARESNTEQG